MSATDFNGTCQRTLHQALIHLLETQYGLLGSRRVLEMLAKDVQRLAEEFYPASERLSSGWMVFTGTRASGGKAHPGQGAGEHELVTLAWPVLLPEDLQYLLEHGNTRSVRGEWFCKRLVRILEYGYDQPDGAVLLTMEDLSAMTGLDPREVCRKLQRARIQTGKLLPTKGYFFDQGVRPTHKAEIIKLYESGLDETEIARQSEHAPESVGQYIRDYERVKLLLEHNLPVGQIAPMTGLQPSVVKAYAKLVEKYHPHLGQRQEVILLASQD
jgi:hypothetical protein